jgi:hypothetical protein
MARFRAGDIVEMTGQKLLILDVFQLSQDEHVRYKFVNMTRKGVIGENIAYWVDKSAEWIT